MTAREIEQRVIRRQELARRLALGIAAALRERGIRQIAVDHETVTLQRLDGELKPPSSFRPIDIARRCHDAASIARALGGGKKNQTRLSRISNPRQGGLIYNSLGCRTATALVTQRAWAVDKKLLAAVSKTRANAFSYSR